MSDGKVITVRYHELVPMLLKAKQAEQIQKLSAEVAEDKVSGRLLSNAFRPWSKRGRLVIKTRLSRRQLADKRWRDVECRRSLGTGGIYMPWQLARYSPVTAQGAAAVSNRVTN